jgi:uncharacterized protein YjiS (DUF1127 family)
MPKPVFSLLTRLRQRLGAWRQGQRQARRLAQDQQALRAMDERELRDLGLGPGAVAYWTQAASAHEAAVMPDHRQLDEA